MPLSHALETRLERLGADVQAAGRQAQKPADGRLTTAQYFTFWEALGASSPVDLGLRLAAQTQPHEYDLSSLAALHSPSLRTAFEKMARYKRLCGPKEMAIDTEGSEVRIHTRWLHSTQRVPPRLVDASLASVVVLAQRGIGRAIAPKRVELARRRDDEPLLMRFFGCRIRFNASADALVFDEALLDAPFVTYNAELLGALIPGLEAKLEPSSPRTFLDEVRAVINRRMTGERPSVQKVARELALSARTLQRRLGEEGVSYQLLLDDVRHAAARRMLRESTLDVSEVAFLLGFEELNSFTRAFSGWEGTTPKRWRDSMNDRRDRMSEGQPRAS